MSAPATLDRDGIAARVPHAGAMCVLEAVTRWDAAGLEAIVVGHRDPAHPLRGTAGLGAAAAIEFGAQASAVHGALLGEAEAGGAAAQPGRLVSVRGVRLHVGRLDTLGPALTVVARRLGGGAEAQLYAFSVEDGDATVVEGRLAVQLVAR